MDKQNDDVQKKLEAFWKKNEANVMTDDEGDYISLKNINLADHGLDAQDFSTPGNQSLSPTTDTNYDNYFMRGTGVDRRLFRKRDYKRNV